MSAAKPALRLVDPAAPVTDPETGEVVPHEDPRWGVVCRLVQALTDLEMAEQDLRQFRTKVANLTGEKERERRAYAKREIVEGLFDYWRERCKHPNSKLDAIRFDLLRTAIEGYGEAICRRAVDGAATDPFCTRRKNGTTCRHDDLSLIFRDSKHVEDFANRAPRAAS